MSALHCSVLNTVDDIKEEQWQSLNCETNIYFNKALFKAFENANQHIEFNYILVLNKEEKAVAIATLQILPIDVDSIATNLSFSERINHKLSCFFRKNQVKVLFCGNVFVSGEHGIFVSSHADSKATFKALSKCIKTISTDHSKGIDVIFIKDFKEESLKLTDQFTSYRYSRLEVEPNMILELTHSFSSFEEYKSQLKSKYRVKVNKADQKSEILETKPLDVNAIKSLLPELQRLYENTVSKSNFNAQILNLETYLNLKYSYQNEFIIQGYFLENKLVGFLSGLVNNKQLDAHFVGIDYNYNKQYSIYPRILNDYVRLGFELNVERVNFGRTASEIKSTLGAVPEDLVCYIRHKKSITNLFLKPFFSQISMKPFKQHQPFKTKKEA
ncbi:MAG: hypothetical protein BM564_03910 [Bacteroidetes bacterium MedPE-SWsnd-G2]|nr:MAG: hypothetical protein BM564_03910 [Bacteroidetes bacterium MedPE-SWsnd-G2]